MKKLFLITGCLMLGIIAWGQNGSQGEVGCDCPSCLAKEASGKAFTLPALQGLVEADEHADCDHDVEEVGHDEHAEHDHAVDEVGHDEHAGHDHAADEVGDEDHADCDHASEEPELDEHAGHDHAGEAVGLEISTEMGESIGLQIHEAESGTIAKASVFPAEIKLNRDRTAAVSPRYASIVRQVFAEIGDTVKAGDVLASLENRETMAVYTISAPLDGVIISKNLTVGEAAAEDKVLFEVADLSSVWADINIFPKYQHLIRRGMSVKLIAHDGHSTRGTVKYISPILSHETRTFTARCILTGANDDFTPGAFVRARINIETADVAVRVERDAVQMLEGIPVIFIPNEHGFQIVEVELGLADDYSIEVKNGLLKGDRYVAVGAFALKAQMVTSGMDPHAGHGH
jgi:cobalt-zinc-cadmium efflux system membrane fusion protein